MRLALIAEHFPPMRSSCAVQMRDLAFELRDRGHQVTVLVPGHDLRGGYEIEDCDDIVVVRLRAFRTQDRNYAVRMLGELAMPFMMLRNWRRSKLANRRFDGIVWYSPNIFFGPLVSALKKESDCPAYLILRDIFPEWAADVGVLSEGRAYRFLQQVARYQYTVADVIGVQTPANLAYFQDDIEGGKSVEVLQNWMRAPAERDVSGIDLSGTPIKDRAIFVYAGNMGVAQGMDRLIDLASELKDDERFGFLFVGRGSDVGRLESVCRQRGLSNTIFHDEIDPKRIPALYAQASAGLVALDPRHRWHNIPGKFISYMHAGLPVLAAINPGNDLVSLVEKRGVGRVSVVATGKELASLAISMFEDELRGDGCAQRCRGLAQDLFSAATAARQIETALEEKVGP